MSPLFCQLLPSLAPALSPVNRNWPERSSQVQHCVQYFLVWAISLENNKYCFWQRVIIIYQWEHGPLDFWWKRGRAILCLFLLFIYFLLRFDFLLDILSMSNLLKEKLFTDIEKEPYLKVFYFILLPPLRLLLYVQTVIPTSLFQKRVRQVRKCRD